jgi:hypothetical protein
MTTDEQIADAQQWLRSAMGIIQRHEPIAEASRCIVAAQNQLVQAERGVRDLQRHAEGFRDERDE